MFRKTASHKILLLLAIIMIQPNVVNAINYGRNKQQSKQTYKSTNYNNNLLECIKIIYNYFKECAEICIYEDKITQQKLMQLGQLESQARITMQDIDEAKQSLDFNVHKEFPTGIKKSYSTIQNIIINHAELYFQYAKMLHDNIKNLNMTTQARMDAFYKISDMLLQTLYPEEYMQQNNANQNILNTQAQTNMGIGTAQQINMTPSVMQQPTFNAYAQQTTNNTMNRGVGTAATTQYNQYKTTQNSGLYSGGVAIQPNMFSSNNINYASGIGRPATTFYR